MPKDIPSRMVYARNIPIIGKLAYYTLKLLGVEIPLSVKIGSGFESAHGGVGIVIHPLTSIGNHVKIYPGVTIGRADIHNPMDESKFEGILIDDGVILASGAKVMGKKGFLTVASGSIIGANAVLMQSTEQNEIWAGIPARCIGKR